MADIAFSCRCGQVTGTLRNAGPNLGQGLHCRCQCRSCRAARLYLQEPDPFPEGVDLYQCSPTQIGIATGQDQLCAFQVTENGLVLRVYAGCCNSTLFTCALNPRVPAMSIATERLAESEPLGPVRATAFIRKEGGGVRHENLKAFVLGMLARYPSFLRRGGSKRHPLFDDEGKPITPIHLLTEAERSAFPGF